MRLSISVNSDFFLSGLLSLLLICGCGGALPFPQSGGGAQTKTRDRLAAERWAPVVYHNALSKMDVPTNVDYDGDWIGNNNWENFDAFPKKAFVYYDVKETADRWYVFYSFFHPRDVAADIDRCPFDCHENDMEEIQLVIKKGSGGIDALEYLSALAHGDMRIYNADGSAGSGTLPIAAPYLLEGGRPVVYVSLGGHAIYGTPNPHDGAGATTDLYPIYRFTFREGEAAEPEELPVKSGPVLEAGYALLPIHDTIWMRRNDRGDGGAFDGSMNFRGVDLPGSMDGDTHGVDSAGLPWRWGKLGVNAGDWFFDPARAYPVLTGEMEDATSTYLFNPYVDEMESEGADWGG